MVKLLLLGKIALAGIAQATGVSESWLQSHVNAYYEAVPKTAEVVPKAKGKLRVQMDKLWSFVDHKGNKQWVWLAIDTDTRKIIGCHRCLARTFRYTTWQSSQIHNAKIGVWGALRAPQTPIFA